MSVGQSVLSLGSQIIWEESVKFGRSGARYEFENKYWSVNRAVINTGQMPQPHTHYFCGKLMILRLKSEALIPRDIKMIDQYCLCGAVEALEMGWRFPNVVREFKSILALGSIGPIFGAPRSERQKFCPDVFSFSDDPESTVSVGVSRLDIFEDEEAFPRFTIRVPSGTNILVAVDG